MRRLGSVIFAAALLCMMVSASCGCSEDTAKKDDDRDRDTRSEMTSRESSSRPVNVDVSIADSDNQQTDYVLDAGDEWGTQFVITFDGTVYDLQLLRLNDSDDSDISTETVAELDTVQGGETVMLIIDIGEVIPVAGFSFEDDTGITRYYSLGISGDDGSAIVNRIDSFGYIKD